jgi:hypothetical protein
MVIYRAIHNTNPNFRGMNEPCPACEEKGCAKTTHTAASSSQGRFFLTPFGTGLLLPNPALAMATLNRIKAVAVSQPDTAD